MACMSAAMCRFLAFLSVLSLVAEVATSFSVLTSKIPRRPVSSLQLSDEAGEPWMFRGHIVYTESSQPTQAASLLPSLFVKKPAVLLIHGFGCSTTYWRKTKAALLDGGYEVHAVDLLGQGQSSKPGRSDGIEYTIRLWAEQVDKYIREKLTDKEVVLFGNSLGSLIALSAVTGDFDTKLPLATWNEKCKGICMFNCGVGLNSRGIANEDQWNDFQRVLINVLYTVIETLIFRNFALLSFVLDKVVTQELLRETLQSLYRVNPANVDDELVDSFYYPAKDDGSVEALSQIYTNDPGATPMDLHRSYASFLNRLPIHLVWGDDDAVTPLGGGVGQYYANLASLSENQVTFEEVPGGHILFDDNPIDSNDSMLSWLKKL